MLLKGSYIDSYTSTASIYTLKTSLSKRYRVQNTIKISVGHIVVKVVLHAIPILVIVSNAQAENTLA